MTDTLDNAKQEGVELQMDRRVFLRLTGLVAAASALDAWPVAAQMIPTEAPPDATTLQPSLHAPGTYHISGRVRLDEPLVAITGITNAQQISWSDLDRTRPHLASFSSFEYFPEPWSTPNVRVQGGRLEGLAIVPVDDVA